MGSREAARIFNIPETTLRRRMNKQRSREESRVDNHKLDLVEEQTLIQYIIDQDVRGFPMRLSGVEDMANLLLASRDGKPVGIANIAWRRGYHKGTTSRVVRDV
jgi:hypothetical protein